MPKMSLKQISEILELLFVKYNHRKYVCSDPLMFLYRYKNIRDREIVGVISSSLAYGRVKQILKSVSFVLDQVGSSPYQFVRRNSYVEMCRIFNGFKHRFANAKHLAALLFGIKKVLQNFGSLNRCFESGMMREYDNILPGLICFFEHLKASDFSFGHLVPDPKKGSACKRLNLFLRWMVRRDIIDPGGWYGIPASRLIVPLDTHMHKVGFVLGFTKQKRATLKTALEITSGFRRFNPLDPVKYDFSLTRPGILKGLSLDDFLRSRGLFESFQFNFD